MSNILIHDVGMGMGNYLKTRPDIFRPERSPRRTIFWIIVMSVGVAIAITAIVNPEAFVRGGRESVGVRGGLGMIIAPVVFIGLGVTGIIMWSRRWRTPQGGKMSHAITVSFAAVDPDLVWSVIENATSATDPALTALLSASHNSPAQPGSWSLEVMHAPDDRIAVAMVTRQVQKKPGDPNGGVRSQLEREPVIRRDEQFINFREALDAVR
ncbi:hypothetical protein ACFWHR_00815 [Leucobacter sp. NPDC058333]|uniref:hypothetical protein n=1 Tax=Leucobacter sp. NPDC058333 TaxID=3346450 RepID=UPI003668EA00